jgi:hypothetical protein
MKARTSSQFKALTLLGTASILAASLGYAYIDPSEQPMTRERLVQMLVDRPNVTTLDQVPAILPGDFLINFVLKHGNKIKGERGHLIETKVSQSSDPLLPRAIIYDERTAFTVSYNGGAPEQTANQRLDLLSFDFGKKAFSLQQIDFPIAPSHPQLATTDCATCHGPNLRPIFSMYPDWPSFYGSDNDELTGDVAVEEKEFADYRAFRAKTVPTHPRYSPLYFDKRVESRLGLKMYPSFPYRPDVSERIRDTSRAFAFRPALRLGILYNRLMAQSVGQRIKEHKNYDEFGPYFLFNLLECNWSANSASARAAWASRVEKALGKPAKIRDGGLLDYRQALALFDLRVNDIDIRYSYNHAGYENEDASKKPMELGYIGRYFNSYFDGSATIDELLATQLHADMTKNRRGFKVPATPRGLTTKYQHLEERFKLDENFFRQMDRHGMWLPIPYPLSLNDVHHREGFGPELVAHHRGMCTALESQLR